MSAAHEDHVQLRMSTRETARDRTRAVAYSHHVVHLDVPSLVATHHEKLSMMLGPAIRTPPESGVLRISSI